MNEKRWRAAKSVGRLRAWCMARRRRNLRKERLFACACCRRLWGYLIDKRSRAAVEAAEQFADGLIDREKLDRAREAAILAAHIAATPDIFYLAPEDAAECVASPNRDAVFEMAPTRVLQISVALERRSLRQEQREQVDLFRDLFGNPFRKVKLPPSWRTDTAMSLARTMYESRDFSAMPILADALQEAGCDNDDILAHCRDPKQVHVRGCWVVDLILGKS